MIMSRIATVLLVRWFIAPLTVPTAARADEWPSRTIRFIVPYPPGGSTDVGARLFGNARLVRRRGIHVN